MIKVNKKIIVVLLALVINFMFTIVASAATGDVYNVTKKKIYKKEVIATNLTERANLMSEYKSGDVIAKEIFAGRIVNWDMALQGAANAYITAVNEGKTTDDAIAAVVLILTQDASISVEVNPSDYTEAGGDTEDLEVISIE